MNGAVATSEATVRSTLVHEIGHALGLDHSQINSSFANNGDVDDDKFLPTMFPTATDDDTELVQLNPDDLAAITRLYPGPGAAKQYGTMKGVLVRQDKSSILGANILAILVKNTTVEDPLHRYSCVSDFLMAGTGAFELLVPPGRYRLRAEPVRRAFVGGSSVGPYARTASDVSFKQPIKAKPFSEVTVTAGNTVDVGSLIAQ